MYTTEADIGKLFTSDPTDPLVANNDTLKPFVAGTELEGRATVGDLPDGKLGVTRPDGSVIIDPKAFRSADALMMVIDHEGVHVNQLMNGNFNGNPTGVGKHVNELQAWRSTVRFIDSHAGSVDMDEAWAAAVDHLVDEFSDIDMGRGGGAYLSHVTGALPYTYILNTEDTCPMTVCNPSGYKR